MALTCTPRSFNSSSTSGCGSVDGIGRVHFKKCSDLLGFTANAGTHITEPNTILSTTQINAGTNPSSLDFDFTASGDWKLTIVKADSGYDFTLTGTLPGGIDAISLANACNNCCCYVPFIELNGEGRIWTTLNPNDTTSPYGISDFKFFNFSYDSGTKKDGGRTMTVTFSGKISCPGAYLSSGYTWTQVQAI